MLISFPRQISCDKTCLLQAVTDLSLCVHLHPKQVLLSFDSVNSFLLCSYFLPFAMTPLFGLLSSFIHHIVVDFCIPCPSHIRCLVGTFECNTLCSVVLFHLCCMVDWSLLWPVIQTDNSLYDTSIWFHISSTERPGWPWHWVGRIAFDYFLLHLHVRLENCILP